MIKVSVIIPTYNRASYLPRAIDSILSQSFKGDCEIIVVDDGSTDDTREVVDSYGDKVRYIYKENGGVSSARNRGIKEAKYDWIAFLDSDDYWKREKLSMQVKMIEEYSLKICFTAIEIINGLADDSSQIVKVPTDETFKVYDEPFELLLWCYKCTYMQSMLIDKQLLMSIGGFDEILPAAEDTMLTFTLGLDNVFGLVNEPLTVLERQDSRQGLMNDGFETQNKFRLSHIEIITGVFNEYTRGNKKIIKKLKDMLNHLLSQEALYRCCNREQGYSKYAWKALDIAGDFKVNRRALAVLLIPFVVRSFLCKQYRCQLNEL